MINHTNLVFLGKNKSNLDDTHYTKTVKEYGFKGPFYVKKILVSNTNT